MVTDITPIQQSIKLIKETLQKIPPGIILSDHIGMIRPVKGSDLPAIVISVKNIKELGPGIGNFIGVHREDTDIFQEFKGSKIIGVFQLDIWDTSAAKIDEITTAAIEMISNNKKELEIGGFLKISLDSFGEIKPSNILTGPIKDSLVRSIDYRGIFEFINIESFGPGGIIKEIHAKIDDILDESMIIKK